MDNKKSVLSQEKMTNASPQKIVDNKVAETKNTPHLKRPTEEEAQSSNPKRYHEDKDTIIKNEIKICLWEKVKDEMKEKELRSKIFHLDEEASQVKERIAFITRENKQMEREFQIGKYRHEQFEKNIENTESMIVCVKEALEELEIRLQTCEKNDILAKCEEQYKKFLSIEKQNEKKMEQQKQLEMKLTADYNEKKSQLLLDAENRKMIYDGLKKRNEEMKIIIKSRDDELVQLLNKRQTIREKLEGIVGEGKARSFQQIEELVSKQAGSLLSKLEKEKSDLTERLRKYQEEKREADEKLEEAAAKKEEFAAQKEEVNKTKAEKLERLDELNKKLIQLKNSSIASIEQLQEKKTNVDKEIQDLNERIKATQLDRKNKEENLKALQETYLKKCEEKMAMIQDILDSKKEAFDLKSILIEKRNERINLKEKEMAAESRHTKVSTELSSLEEQIAQLRNNSELELSQLRAKCKSDQLALNKYNEEMEKKKKYLLASSQYLKEKLTLLTDEAEEKRETVKNMEDEVEKIKNLIIQKEEVHKGLNVKLQNITQERANTSMTKSPKKVQFNDVLEFKSPTESSDVSSQQSQNQKPSETFLFSEWLKKVNAPIKQ